MNARVEEVYLLSTSTIAAFLDTGQIEQLSGHLLFCCEDDTIFGEDTEDGSCSRDGFHGIFDWESVSVSNVEQTTC